MLAPDAGVAAIASLLVGAGFSAPPPSGAAETVWLQQRARLYAQPGVRPLATLAPRTPYGSRARFWVRARKPGWLKVTSEDGVRNTGWIAARRTAAAAPILHRIVIDRSARRLTYIRGKTRWSTGVVVGAHATPTPLGAFQVTDSLDGKRFSGTYGHWILVLSAYGTPAKTTRLAVHGIPPDARNPTGSAGCVRVPKSALERLRRVIAPGTPVTVRE